MTTQNTSCRNVGNPEVTNSGGGFSFPSLVLLENAQLRVVTDAKHKSYRFLLPFPRLPEVRWGARVWTLTGASLAVAVGPGSRSFPPTAVTVAVKLSNGSTFVSCTPRRLGFVKNVSKRPSLPLTSTLYWRAPATALQVTDALVP